MSSQARTTSAAPRKNNDEGETAGVSSPVSLVSSRSRRRSGFAISRDGAAIFFEVMGAARPALTLLLCDGLGCDGYVWKYLQWALGEHFRIIHFHYRGHGRTPLPADISRISVTDFAHDALAVLDACETERAVVLGHSLGCQVALETYKLAPARTAALVLLCGSYGNPLRTFKGSDILADILPIARAAVSRMPRLLGAFWKSVIPTELSYLLAQRLEINGALVSREDFFPYLEGMSRMDPRMFVSTLAAAGQHNAKDLLPDIKAPTLIVAGRRDSFTPMALSEEMGQLIVDSELHVVEEGTHTAPIERPAEVAEVVLEFLQRRVPSP